MLTDNSEDMKSTGRIWCGPKLCKSSEGMIKEWSSLGHYLLHELDGDSANVTIITDFASGRQYTGLELKHKVLAVACALRDKYDFKSGTVICMNYSNSDLLLILALAVVVCGGTVSCAYHKDPYAELLHLAKKVEPKFLFIHAKRLNWARQLSSDLGLKILGVAMDDPNSGESFAELLNYDYQRRSKALDSLPVACHKPLKKQVAFVSLSSGTTGRPKAISFSHWNALADLITLRSSSSSQNVSFACCASLDYVSGRLVMLGAIKSGYNTVILDDFEPKSYLESIQKFKVSTIYLGIASFYNMITYEHIDQYDLSSVRCIFPMGAKLLYPDEMRKFLQKNPNIRSIRTGYGASETIGACIRSATPEEYLDDSDNCGKLLPGVQAKLVEPKTGRLLGPNEVGVLHIRGETVFPGYYDMEQARQRRATARSNVATSYNEDQQPKLAGCQVANDEDDDDLNPFVWDESVFDDEGYYITGDLGYFNDKEEFYVIGRQKEMMSCRFAKKVLPQELEEVIRSHPAVSKVCVLGVQNKKEPTLHCPRAFIVPEPECYDLVVHDPIPSHLLGPKVDAAARGAEPDDQREELCHAGQHKLCRMDLAHRRSLAEDLMEFVDSRVGWEKQLTGGVVILDEIPISRGTGKFNKNYLRSLNKTLVEMYGDRSE